MVQNGEEDIGIEIVGEAVEVPLKKSAKSKGRVKEEETTAQAKRRCVSTACIACRRRKSKVCKHVCSTSDISSALYRYVMPQLTNTL